jgi:hypothetical protein
MQFNRLRSCHSVENLLHGRRRLVRGRRRGYLSCLSAVERDGQWKDANVSVTGHRGISGPAARDPSFVVTFFMKLRCPSEAFSNFAISALATDLP